MTKGHRIAMTRLTEGRLKSMFPARVKSMSGMILAMVIGGGFLVIARAGDPARGQPQPAAQVADRDKQPAEGAARRQASLSLVEFNTLHKDLMQSLWWSIPWKTSIREGRELAVKEKKPIVYWAVQGHVMSLC
jgi:hypothetical protein